MAQPDTQRSRRAVEATYGAGRPDMWVEGVRPVGSRGEAFTATVRKSMLNQRGGASGNGGREGLQVPVSPRTMNPDSNVKIGKL